MKIVEKQFDTEASGEFLYCFFFVEKYISSAFHSFLITACNRSLLVGSGLSPDAFAASLLEALFVITSKAVFALMYIVNLKRENQI